MGSVADTDKGYRARMKQLRAKLPVLKVGVYGEQAEAIDGEGTITVGALAEIFEFGLGNQPERSWLRGYVDENNARITQMIARVGEQVAAGKMTPEEALNLVGLKMVGEIQQRISAGIEPPNEDSTIRRKGSSTPLIDTGQFRGSISHEVVPAGSDL